MRVIIICILFVLRVESVQKRAAVANKQRLWPNGLIPYVINDTFPGELQRLFQIAMKHWENHTCITFIPKRPLDKDYIIFTTDKCGCCSYVGRKGGGAQIISIGKNCDKFGIIVHELGHVVGFSHEHTRPDRDKYVEIFRNNIQDGQDYNFDKAKTNEIDSRGEIYDYNSIMHYARDTFARAAYLDTILPRKPVKGERPKIGQRNRLSEGDIRQTNKMYECPSCFHTLLAHSGEIKPDLNHSTCNWRIIAALGERIKLNISTNFLTNSKFCYHAKQNFIEIRDGFTSKSKLLDKICTSTTKSFVSSKNVVFIHFSSKILTNTPFATFQVFCGSTITANHGIIQSPRYPEPYLPETECFWNIRVSKGFRVAVIFRYFNLETHKECLYDNLEIYEGPDAFADNLISKFCGQAVPKYVVTNSSNEMVIRFFSDSSIQKTGFHLEFIKEIDECKNSNHGCEHLCVDEVGGYHCECLDGFLLADDKKSCENKCGGHLTNPSGQFSPNNVLKNNSSNKNCTWQIKATPDYHIVLNFTFFGSDEANCEENHVLIKDANNESAENDIRICPSSGASRVLLLRTDNIRVDFNLNDLESNLGFIATYRLDFNECSKDNGGCEQVCVNTIDSYLCKCQNGLKVMEDQHSCSISGCFYQNYDPFGAIHSPNFPDYYPTGKNCTWHILTTPGQRIILNFDYFDIEDHYTCKYDFISVFDGGDQKANKLGSFCGQNLPPPMTSSGNQLVVQLRSDETQPRKGFNASYISQCGGRLKVETSVGYVYSHARYGERQYPKLTSCLWEIYSDVGVGIKLEFTQFDVEKETSCGYDHVAIYDGLTRKKELLIGTFCGDDLPPIVISTSNGLLIEFITDDNIEKNGFVVEYSSASHRGDDEKEILYD